MDKTKIVKIKYVVDTKQLEEVAKIFKQIAIDVKAIEQGLKLLK